PADSTGPREPRAPPVVAPGTPGTPGAPAGRGTPGAPAATRDSTPAMRMLARRPAPTDARLVGLAEPLTPDTRYLIVVDGARSLSGISSVARAQLSVPKPRRQTPAGRRAPADPTRPPADTPRPTRDTIPMDR
ncbi:MAG: hypothetical protein Q8Q85_12420, partial [Gemmatimonadales bacterium]|nr:hypothetical protein [Gemmatimonadales bacterium]